MKLETIAFELSNFLDAKWYPLNSFNRVDFPFPDPPTIHNMLKFISNISLGSSYGKNLLSPSNAKSKQLETIFVKLSIGTFETNGIFFFFNSYKTLQSV